VRLSTESFYGLVLGEPECRLEVDGIRSSVRVTADQSVRPTFWDDAQPVRPQGPRSVRVLSDGWTTELDVFEAWAASGHDGAGAGPTTPVPGTVTHVAVAVGDEVEAGAALVVLEAMKMEHTIRADAAGTVTEIHVSVGQSVDAHTVVATLEATS
jgi:biotin carboxyl carrier protein